MVFVAASRWCWVGLAALLLLQVIPSYTHQVQDQQSLSQNHDAPQQRYLRPKATRTLHSTSLGSSWLEDLGGHYQTHFPPATTLHRTPSHPTGSNLGYSRQETTTYNSEHYRWVDPVNDFGQDHREHSRYDSAVHQKAARQDARHQYDVHNHHQEQNNLYTTNLQPPQPYPQQEPYSSQHGQLFTGHQQMFLPHQNLALQGEAHLVGNHTLQPQQTLAHTILHSGHHSDMSSTAAPHHHENSIPQNHSAVLNNQQDSVLDRKEGASVSATRSQQELGNSDSSRQREVYTGQRPSRSSGGDKKRPNILLIMTDDQDVDLGSLNYMPNLMSLMKDGGANFINAYCSTPICCPSRSSMLTGLYIHNHEVYTNNHNCSSRQWQETHERRSFATYLRAAGYRTGYFGKYLNKYNGSHVPAGWQEWGGLLKNSRYYNYTVQRNGQFIKYGDQYPKDYYPHVITSEGINFLKKHKGMNPSSPMLLVLSYPAPHGPEDSAPEHAHRFFNATDHNTMAYNYAPNPDKQWLLQFIGRMHDIELKFTDLLMTKRLQTLQTVDEALAKLINTLEAVGELNNTYIFYTSDHGYHLGQFGLVKGKSMPFEFDIKVPFLARGPGIRSGSQISKIALNVDLAPTFLDIAGLEVPPHMDGRSLLPVLKSTSFGQSDTFAWRDSFLVESSGRHREEDALELREQRRLQRAQGLTGAETEGGLYTSKRERLEIICQGDEYRSPCKPHQKWECIRGEYRWRLQKCRKKRVRRPRIKWRQRNCVCEPDLGMGYLVKLDSAERRKQRIFLKKHVTQDLKKYDAKFIKVFSDVDSSEIVERYLGALVLQNSSGLHSHEIRYRRSIKEEMSVMEMNNEDSVYEDSGADDVDAFVKEEEIREIDVTIDSLTDELESLESVSSTAATSIVNGNVSLLATSLTGKTPVDTRHGCRVTGTSVDCTDDVYHDPHAWKLSKFVIDQQIRRLRHQLIVMKDIRKHLRDSRPESVVNSEDYDSYEDETGVSRDLNILIGENHFLGQNDAGDTSRIEASDVFEGEPGYERIYDAVDVDVNYENDAFNSSEDISENEHFKGQDGPSNPDYDEEGYHDGEDSSNVEDGQVIIIGTDYHMVGETHHQRNNLKNPEDLGRKEEDHTTLENPRADVTQMQRVPGRYRSQAGKQFHLFPVREPSQQQPLTTVDNETSERSRCWCDKNFRLEIKQAERQRKREERLKLRLERQRVKQERRQIKEKKKLRKLKNNLAQCNYTMLNCYTHDNDHWRTPPLWHDGKFCFCMNAINNTYWCVRTINQTHNFLYCEFITGLVTYYDLNIDPHQLRNVAFTLSNKRLAELHHRLESLRTCSGASHCDDLPTFEISKSNDRENLHNREEDKISNSVEVPVLTRLDKHLTHRREKRRRLREERARQRKERRRVRKQQKNRRRNQFYEDRGKHILHTTGSDRHVVRLPRKSRIQERRREQKGHRREIRKEHKRRKKSQRERISLNG